jgi:ketosteroid isomerase-like protein
LEREAAIAEMQKDFDPAFDEGLQIEVEPLSFHAGIASDGDAAWSAAPLRYGINFQEETSSFVLRHTSVFARSDQRWSIRVTQYSLSLPEENILQAMMTGNLPAPHPIVDAIGAGAHVLVESFKQQLADLSGAAIGQNAYVFGPFPGEYAEGETAIRALFAKWTSTWGALRLWSGDGVRAEFIAEGMGWVGANVEVVLSYGNQQVAVPLRVLMVYQKEQENWGIAHAHFSVGIPDELAE